MKQENQHHEIPCSIQRSEVYQRTLTIVWPFPLADNPLYVRRRERPDFVAAPFVPGLANQFDDIQVEVVLGHQGNLRNGKDACFLHLDMHGDPVGWPSECEWCRESKFEIGIRDNHHRTVPLGCNIDLAG